MHDEVRGCTKLRNETETKRNILKCETQRNILKCKTKRKYTKNPIRTTWMESRSDEKV